ncbi:MAG: hypothetical protein IKC69_07565 [Clostridia bacterium]|nr:hypothetical protein [Clostridia bacterium]
MKKLIALLVVFSTLASLAACAGDKASETATLEPTLSVTETLGETAQTEEETESVDDGIRVYSKVDDPLTRAKLDAIPIANSSMSIDELRDICVRYFKLAVSFQWIPDGDMILEGETDPYRSFTEGVLYGGIPYINTASGNLYRILEYYDEETGILDTSWLGKHPDLFGNACSGSAGWAWYRVINSAEISWTHSINAAHGFVPVGPYKYDPNYQHIWTTVNGTRVYEYSNKTICKNNGKQVMFESYALTLPADCYGSNGHVRMAAEKPVVVRKEDGTIDGNASYIILVEQGLYNTSDAHKRVTSDGTVYRIRGNDGGKWTFEQLYKDGYIPHTFKEFLGQDPIEPGEATIEHSGPTASSRDLAKGNLKATYPISDVFTTVYDKDGKAVLAYKYRSERHFVKSIALAECIPFSYFSKYQANSDHTVEIKAQIANGELITVYSGTLIPPQ